MIDRTKEGPLRTINGLIGQVQITGFVITFAGIMVWVNAAAVWFAAVALILVGLLVLGLGIALNHYFNAAWDELLDDPQGIDFLLQLNRYGRKEFPNEH